jgi:hypothetical protein
MANPQMSMGAPGCPRPRVSRSRTDAATKNETMCKVLIHEIHELGIEPVFWPTKEV